MIVTGDLVDQGDPQQYEHLKTLLAPLELPCFLMVGNHDDRAALRAAFPDRAELHSGGEFVQYAFDAGALRVIALDSLVPGESGGTLCDARLAWLEAQLDAASGSQQSSRCIIRRLFAASDIWTSCGSILLRQTNWLR